MFSKRHVVAGIAAAALASAALVSSAAADPTDDVLLDTANHEFSFGEDCSPGDPPALAGVLDWQENAAKTTIRPRLRGRICLQDTTSEARMSVIYHNADHDVVSKFSSNPATGNGGALSEFVVNDTGARVSSSVVTHVLVRLEVPDPNGGWDSLTSVSRTYPG
jgi:hypothetical protein